MSANAGRGQNVAKPKIVRVMVRSFRIKSATYPVYRPCSQTIFFRKRKIFNLTSAECAKGVRLYIEDANSTIRRRICASGSRPTPPCILSPRWSGLSVAGMAQVTAGCATIHFRKSCAQTRQSNSVAQSGNDFECACLKRSPLHKNDLFTTHHFFYFTKSVCFIMRDPQIAEAALTLPFTQRLHMPVHIDQIMHLHEINLFHAQKR